MPKNSNSQSEVDDSGLNSEKPTSREGAKALLEEWALRGLFKPSVDKDREKLLKKPFLKKIPF